MWGYAYGPELYPAPGWEPMEGGKTAAGYGLESPKQTVSQARRQGTDGPRPRVAANALRDQAIAKLARVPV